MQAYKSWNKRFTKKHIKEHYLDKISKHPSVGLDKITPSKFSDELESNIEIILRKVNNGTYRFTRYKQLLISKGADKPPRCISVPTIRDKLTLSVVNEILMDVYNEKCTTQMPQVIINEIMTEKSNFTHFIKIDIKSFFASIDQRLLISTLHKNIHKKQLLRLIESAIQTPAISLPAQSKMPFMKKTKGIPEGLSISNSIANVFLSELDEKYSSLPYIKYWRYVDDILILVNKADFEKVKTGISEDISQLKLSINEKKDEGEINKGFTYLGYSFDANKLSVRESSIYKIEESLESLLRNNKSGNLSYLQWKINLKITGFIINKHKYGWLFFFSQITDISLLYHLDELISKYMNRYGLAGKFAVKRFVRAYHEMRNALHTTHYIPNIDLFSIEDKKNILNDIYGVKINKLNDFQINNYFNRIMAKEIQDIEKDVQAIS